MGGVRDMLGRIPWTLLLALYLGYQVWGYYWFKNNAESPYIQRIAEVETLKRQNGELERKINDAREFFKTLEATKARLRTLATELEQMKATLTDQLDVPAIMKMIVVEAARVGLNVTGLRPTETQTKEYYAEQIFDLNFKSVFPQLLVFLDKVASLQTIIRVDSFNIRRTGSSTAAHVELGGTLQLKTYRYLGSKADEIGKGSGGAASAAPSAPSVTPVGPQAGAPANGGLH